MTPAAIMTHANTNAVAMEAMFAKLMAATPTINRSMPSAKNQPQLARNSLRISRLIPMMGSGRRNTDSDGGAWCVVDVDIAILGKCGWRMPGPCDGMTEALSPSGQERPRRLTWLAFARTGPPAERASRYPRTPRVPYRRPQAYPQALPGSSA